MYRYIFDVPKRPKCTVHFWRSPPLKGWGCSNFIYINTLGAGVPGEPPAPRVYIRIYIYIYICLFCKCILTWIVPILHHRIFDLATYIFYINTYFCTMRVFLLFLLYSGAPKMMEIINLVSVSCVNSPAMRPRQIL